MPSTSLTGLHPNIQSKTIKVNGLEVHYLESLSSPSQTTKPPLIILLHGFPDLAYCWRKIVVPLSEAGYHVVAPDLRGYGRTRALDAGPAVHYEDDVAPFRALNMVTDVVGLVFALGYEHVAAVVGHDFGSTVAGRCALARPDIFKSVVMMSAPFTGAPAFNSDGSLLENSPVTRLNDELGKLDPPRKHYAMYYSTPHANADMRNSPQGLHTFLRAYFHVKSADWIPNDPHPLPSLSPSSFAELPHYYIMPLHETMPQCVERDAPSPGEIERNTWLTEEELAVYVSEFSRTGFQGGLNNYRCTTDTTWQRDLLLFAGKQIEVPAMFLSGKQDWGVYQFPGAAKKMKQTICKYMKDEDFVLIDGAGHWVQQEKPGAVLEHLMRFLSNNVEY